MNGDVSKKQIAQAQAYFVAKTREAEVNTSSGGFYLKQHIKEVASEELFQLWVLLNHQDLCINVVSRLIKT